MAINFHLRDRLDAPSDDPMGRAWFGWDQYAPDDELWNHNRGIWKLAERATNERFATMSHGGLIQLVAEITGRVPYVVDGRYKWALTGDVLGPGDPVHDELLGRHAPKTRNPVSCFDTSQLDALSTAQRSRVTDRAPATMVATWNPARWVSGEHADDVEALRAGRTVHSQWSTGGRNSGVEPGDRVFLLLQGDGARGVVGSGICASRIFQDDHWDEDRRGQQANYVLIEWDALLPADDPLPRAELMARIPAGRDWKPQGSGTFLSPGVAAALERLWAQHLGQSALPPRPSARQGRRLDAERRKKVENAAQARLTAHFEDQGWTIKDTRYGNPYDAVATKDGQLRYLEAKGTETAGSSVIVTRGEVDWARNHVGECVLGILSDVRFLPSGEVDPDSGTFEVFDWDPDAGDLVPRDFDWTPSGSGQQNRRSFRPGADGTLGEVDEA